MKINNWLQKQHQILLALYLGVTAFSTYLCVYALRKPFTAATFDGIVLWGINYKILLVIAHVLGYATSKLIGIKFISELPKSKRSITIVKMAFAGLLALLLFALIPAPYNLVMMFLNGLPLGMMYGLVLSNLEGRRITEVLGAVLCVSFIFGSGIVKSVGRWLIESNQVSDTWMPFCAGLIFFFPLLIFNFLLHQSPSPNLEDQTSRTIRKPMTRQQRRNFVNKYGFGVISLIVVYVMVTILRDIRENFAVEIFKVVHVTDITIFTITETKIGLMVTMLAGVLFVIKDNKIALWVNYIFIAIGIFMIPFVTYLFEMQMIDPVNWMVFVGLGIYMAYVPYNCTLYERLIAVTKEESNISFLLYPADFCGYIGSVSVIFIKNFGGKNINWLDYYVKFAYVLPIIALIFLFFSWVYFRRKFVNLIVTKHEPVL